MKKNVFIILLLSYATILTSCNIKEKGTPNYNPNTVFKVTDPSIRESPLERSDINNGLNVNKKSSDNLNNPTYEIISEVYSNNGVKISYPQIINLSDTNKENKINIMIKNEALKVLNYYKDVDNDLTLEIDYDIKWKGANLISIGYSGIGNVRGSAHPNNLLYTTNVDLVNGSKLRFRDFVNITEDFVEKFRNGNFKSLNPDLSYVQNSFNTEGLIKMFNNADSLDNIDLENQSDVFSYFTKDSLGISIPVSHAAGDHAEFEIKIQDIAHNINPKNNAWKDFSKLLS